MNGPMYDQWDIQDLAKRIYELEQEKDATNDRLRKLEQHTEPITIPRIELDPGGIQNRLDNHAEILQELSEEQKAQGELLMKTFNEVARANTEFAALKADVQKRFDAVEKRFDAMAQDVQKRFEAIAEVQKLILARLPEKQEGGNE